MQSLDFISDGLNLAGFETEQNGNKNYTQWKAMLRTVSFPQAYCFDLQGP